jgi:hypothetical protein
VTVDTGDNLDAGDLLVFVDASAPNAPAGGPPPLASVDSAALAEALAAAAAGPGPNGSKEVAAAGAA